MTPQRMPRLMLIADQAGARDRPLDEVVLGVARAIDGDLVVQFREPEVSNAELSATIGAIQRRAPTRTALVVNGRIGLAQALEIGLHLPARAALPSRADQSLTLLGRSVHDAAEARQALDDAVDYAVVGTIFETTSHPGRSGAGLRHLSQMCKLLAETPCFAIGGIDAATAPLAIEAGAWGVAVRSAILSANDPGLAARRLRDSLPA